MTEQTCTELVKSYIDWLHSKISVKTVGEYCEIETPFLDQHNDHIAIYVRQNGASELTLTDDGYTLRELELSGCEIDTPKRHEILRGVLNGHGVRQEGSALVVTASPENFPQRKHALIQAILAVNDMFMISQAHVANYFIEDVERYLRLHDVRFVKDVQLQGRSGFPHSFNFVIPESKAQPERLIRAVNLPDRNNISALLFAWDDTRESRSAKAQAIAVLNDTNKKVGSGVISALERYSVQPLIWSNRENFLSLLSG